MNPAGTHMLRHLLLVTCMNGVKISSRFPLTIKQNHSHEQGFETFTRESRPCFGSIVVLFCGVQLCRCNPLLIRFLA